ncbi:MAG: Cof-type HAD-IIB family hydrolase [Phycisphaerae bacterium]
MSFPFRLAAIDLDDTLLGPDKQISVANRLAIQKLQGFGVQVVLASGRKHENMASFLPALGGTGYIISGQGALVKHAETGEIVYRAYIPPALSQEVIQSGLAQGFTVLVYHDRAIYAEGDGRFVELYGRLSGDRPEVRKLSDLGGEMYQKVLFLDDSTRISAEFGRVSAAWRGRLDTVVTEPEFIEFTMPGVNKSSALAALAKRMGIAREQVLAFGDGNNDVAMLEWAGLGVAMDHGKDSAKGVADLVVPAGDAETSFARGVEAVFDCVARGHAAA